MVDLLSILGVQVASPDEGVLRAFLCEIRTRHPANGGKLDDYLDAVWAYQAAQDRQRYARDPAAWMVANPRPETLTDWRGWAVSEVHAWLDVVLEGVAEGVTSSGRRPSPEEVSYERQKLVDPWVDFVPLAWDMDQVGWIAGPPEVLDVRHDLAALVRLPELAHMKDATFQVLYRTKEKKKGGQRCLASIKPLSATERALWPEEPAPLFRLEIDWVWWAAMASWTSPRGVREVRYRLLHHELSHARVVEKKDGTLVGRTVGHEIEDFGACVERWGAFSTAHAMFLARGYLHPRTQALLEAVPDEDRTWLVERTDKERLPDTRPVPTLPAWRDEVAALRARLERVRAQPMGVDFGYAPWDEALAQLDVLGALERVGPQEVARLERVRALFRRWAPVVET